jgi:hypothetical protein
MNHVCREIAAYTRACEGLLSKEGTLTEDERSLLEYYVNELSQRYLSDKPTVRLCYHESGSVEPSSATQATAK